MPTGERFSSVMERLNEAVQKARLATVSATTTVQAGPEGPPSAMGRQDLERWAPGTLFKQKDGTVTAVTFKPAVQEVSRGDTKVLQLRLSDNGEQKGKWKDFMEIVADNEVALWGVLSFAERKGEAAQHLRAVSLAAEISLVPGVKPIEKLQVKVGSGEAEVKDLEVALTMLSLDWSKLDGAVTPTTSVAGLPNEAALKACRLSEAEVAGTGATSFVRKGVLQALDVLKGGEVPILELARFMTGAAGAGNSAVVPVAQSLASAVAHMRITVVEAGKTPPGPPPTLSAEQQAAAAAGTALLDGVRELASESAASQILDAVTKCSGELRAIGMTVGCGQVGDYLRAELLTAAASKTGMGSGSPAGRVTPGGGGAPTEGDKAVAEAAAAMAAAAAAAAAAALAASTGNTGTEDPSRKRLREQMQEAQARLDAHDASAAKRTAPMSLTMRGAMAELTPQVHGLASPLDIVTALQTASGGSGLCKLIASLAGHKWDQDQADFCGPAVAAGRAASHWLELRKAQPEAFGEALGSRPESWEAGVERLVRIADAVRAAKPIRPQPNDDNAGSGEKGGPLGGMLKMSTVKETDALAEQCVSSAVIKVLTRPAALETETRALETRQQRNAWEETRRIVDEHGQGGWGIIFSGGRVVCSAGSDSGLRVPASLPECRDSVVLGVEELLEDAIGPAQHQLRELRADVKKLKSGIIVLKLPLETVVRVLGLQRADKEYDAKDAYGDELAAGRPGNMDKDVATDMPKALRRLGEIVELVHCQGGGAPKGDREYFGLVELWELSTARLPVAKAITLMKEVLDEWGERADRRRRHPGALHIDFAGVVRSEGRDRIAGRRDRHEFRNEARSMVREEAAKHAKSPTAPTKSRWQTKADRAAEFQRKKKEEEQVKPAAAAPAPAAAPAAAAAAGKGIRKGAKVQIRTPPPDDEEEAPAEEAPVVARGGGNRTGPKLSDFDFGTDKLVRIMVGKTGSKVTGAINAFNALCQDAHPDAKWELLPCGWDELTVEGCKGGARGDGGCRTCAARKDVASPLQAPTDAAKRVFNASTASVRRAFKPGLGD